MRAALRASSLSAAVILVASLRPSTALAVIVDKVAIRVDTSIIKDSDINRNIRVTEMLNSQPLRMSEAARREAAKRLIDQVFIREEMRVGDYPRAEWSDADKQLDALRKERFRTPGTLSQSLARYGLTEPDLRFEFQWQLNVLRFIDARFRPAVLVTDAEIEKYYREHPQKESLDDASDEIRDQLTGEKINNLFFAWLDTKRKSSRVDFYEADLK